MKILIITPYFYPENFRINDFAFQMVKRGHQVSVLTGLPNYPGGSFFGNYKILRSERVKGVTVYRVPLIARGKSRGFELIINYLSFLLSALILGPLLLRKEQLDIIFSVNYSPPTGGLIGVFFAKLKKAPAYLWVQDLWPGSLVATGAVRSSLVLKMVNLVMKWIYKKSDFILIQSRSFATPIASLGILNEKIHYFPNWAEDSYVSHMQSNDQRFRDLLPKNKFIIMFAGNLGVAQSLVTIVRAALLVRNHPIQWVFLGNGRQTEWLKNTVVEHALEDNISILGKYPLEDMPRFFDIADVMLVTLKQDPVFAMTVPGKIQSYLKSGKPILSALDGEGALVIEESGAGFNVPSGDSSGLAELALKMSQMSHAHLAIMSQRAISYYQNNFDAKALLSRFEILVDKEN
jgi:colanic acid biosynthesis glycosyl transferase WcaI